MRAKSEKKVCVNWYHKFKNFVYFLTRKLFWPEKTWVDKTKCVSN